MEIRGKAAVITGAGGDGSGRAIACRFAREGATVVVADINETGVWKPSGGLKLQAGKPCSIELMYGKNSRCTT